jgi:hypothetical protein
MCDLFGLDTVTAFKEAKVPVRCINSAGEYQLFTPTAVETNKEVRRLWCELEPKDAKPFNSGRNEYVFDAPSLGRN